MEFTDFHCPFCKSSQPTVAALLARYGDQVRLVQHDMPIDQLHPDARKVHEAARCAGDQGKFWEYREHAFPAGPRTATERVQVATEIGLNMPAFNKCVASAAVGAAVRRDEEQARRLQLTSTPTFFINGRLMVGAQPLENFVRIIDDELACAKEPETVQP